MNILDRAISKAKRIAFAPKIEIRSVRNLVTLGSKYGGWTFLDTGSLHKCTIVSAGLGEDASFDVAFAAKYAAKVILIDPTPRAVEHFRQMQARLGQSSRVPYAAHGNQPVEAYDLSGLTRDNLVLIEKALWINKDPVRFYKPANPDHVSHSMANLSGGQSPEGAYIEVPSTTVGEIMQLNALATLPILKIDIEGVEIEVLQGMLADGITPDQILVEFDELQYPSRKTKRKVEGCHEALRRSGYVCVSRNAVNFAYVQERRCGSK